MFKEVTVILFYDGEYIQKLLFSKTNIGGFEVSALFFGHAIDGNATIDENQLFKAQLNI
jgi:hypothetical protein